MLPTRLDSRLLGIGLGWLILVLFYLRFAAYFDPQVAPLGEDFSYFLPALMDGVYWIERNGLFELPWFSPAQCGGLPAFANPQNMFFSPVQWLAVVVGPLAAVKIYFFLMAATGYWSMWRLARIWWPDSVVSWVVASVLFLINGFVVERVLAGHLTYTLFYLTPLLTLLVLPQPGPRRPGWRVPLAGVLWAVVIYAGGAVVVPVIGVAILLLGAIWSLTRTGGRLLLANLLLAGGVGVALAAAKLLPGWEMMTLFPRADLVKLEFASFYQALIGLGYGVFFNVDNMLASDLLAQGSFASKGYGLSYGLTPVALLLVGVGVWRLTGSKKRGGAVVRPVPALVLTGMLLLVLAINLQTGLVSWLPLLADMSSYLPFLSLWMLAVIMLCGYGVAALDANNRFRRGIWLIPVLIIGCSYLLNYSEQQDRRYNPEQLMNAWDRYQAATVESIPRIGQVAAYLDQAGRPGFALNGNELFVRGGSCLLCYEPIFGYRLQRFPFGELRLGAVTQMTSTGTLNFKRPECLLYPEANECVPGEHFRIEERERLERFISYQPIDFTMPLRQKLANWLTAGAWLAVGLVLVVAGWRGIASRPLPRTDHIGR